MKKLSFSILLLSLIFSFTANARDSFRLDNGKMITVGKKKYEIIELVGTPLSQSVVQVAVDNGQGGNPIHREVLVYKLEGSVGGLYLVELTIENGKVVLITSTQAKRI